MPEFWFCDSCKSMNRADAERCYKCRAPQTQATMATVSHRPAGVVLAPGLDEEHRAVAGALMTANRYKSAWRLGYVAAAAVILAEALFVLTIIDAVTVDFADGALDPARTMLQVSPSQGLILTLLVLGTIAAFAATAVVHGAFLGLTSMNTRALGSGEARFGAVRSAFWWLESLGWTVWGLQMFLIPLYIVLGLVILAELLSSLGMILGLGVAILFFACVKFGVELLGWPIASLGKPKRLLQDLTERLGVPGATDSRFVGLWGTAWSAARIVEWVIVVSPLVIVVLLLFGLIVCGILGIPVGGVSASQELLYSTLLSLVPLVIWTGASVFGTYALVRATLEMSRRQRIRERWVIDGLETGPFDFPDPQVDLRARAAQFAVVAQVVVEPGPPAAAPPPAPPAPAAQPLPPPAPAAAQSDPAAAQPAVPAPAEPLHAEPPEPEPEPIGQLEPPYAPLPADHPRPEPRPAEPQPDEEPVVWSRKVERVMPKVAFDAGQLADIPTAWRRAIERSDSPLAQETPAEPPGEQGDIADRPVIQPSASNVGRYRVRLDETAPDRLVEPPPNDIDLGGGI